MTHKSSNKLETLPADIKDDFHYLILQGNSGHRIKGLLEKKYAGDNRLVDADRLTYDSYITMHKPELENDETTRKSLLDSTKESFDQMKDLQNAIATGNDNSIKDQLDRMTAICAKRLEFIWAQQARGFSSPQYENVFVQYMKMLQIFMDKAVQYRKEIESEKDNMSESILNTYEQKFLSAVQNNYKKIHGENKLEEFNNLMSESIIDVVKKTLEEHGYKFEV